MDIATVETFRKHYNPVAPTEFELVVTHLQTGTPGTLELVLSGDVVGEPPELTGYIVVEIYNATDSVICRAGNVEQLVAEMLVKHFGYPAGWEFPQ